MNVEMKKCGSGHDFTLRQFSLPFDIQQSKFSIS